MDWTRLRVPASSANLGPGFDAFAVALDLYLDCRFRPASNLIITARGCDAALIPCTPENLIWQTAAELARAHDRMLSPIELEIENSIPLGKGLGSSAAALTTGIVLANRLLGLAWTRNQVLDYAARIEGHPDNVAACALGGIAVAAIDGSGKVCAVRLEMPARCALAVAIPDFALPTSHARALLPQQYTRDDAVFNIQRAGLLAAAFATGNTDALETALADRIHQPYRAPLVPGLADLLAFRAAGLYGCTLSGAGPAILIFYDPAHSHIPDAVERVLQTAGSTARVKPISVAAHGFRISKDPT